MKKILVWLAVKWGSLSGRKYRSVNGRIQVKERGTDWQDLEAHLYNNHRE